MRKNPPKKALLNTPFLLIFWSFSTQEVYSIQELCWFLWFWHTKLIKNIFKCLFLENRSRKINFQDILSIFRGFLPFLQIFKWFLALSNNPRSIFHPRTLLIFKKYSPQELYSIQELYWFPPTHAIWQLRVCNRGNVRSGNSCFYTDIKE